ncbi:MAG: ATP-binding protein [Janthinobacterium lividum]
MSATPGPGRKVAVRLLHGQHRRRVDERAAAAGGTSVGVRLTRAFGVVVALLLVVGVSGAGGLLVTGHSRDRETQLRQLESANSTLQLAVAAADTSLRDYRSDPQPRMLDDYTRTVRKLPTLRAHVTALVTDPLQRSLFTEQESLIQRWLVQTDPSIPTGSIPIGPTNTGDTNTGDTNTGDTNTEASRTIVDLRDANTRLDVLLRHQRDEATATERWVRDGALVGTGCTLLAALVLVVSTGTRTRRALLDPLQRLVDVIDALGRGEHSAHADPTAGPSEVRTVALAVNDLARENHRLLDDADLATRRQRLAGDIGREVRDQLVAEDALGVAVRRLGEELHVDRVWVRMLEGGGAGGGLGPIAREWSRPPLAPLPNPPRGDSFDDARSWLHELNASGDVYAVADTRTLRGRGAAMDFFLRDTSARALLVVPIGVGETPHGLLTVLVGDDPDRPDDPDTGSAAGAGPRDWSEQEIDLARSVAVDLARALVLAGLYRAQERLLGELRDVESVKSDLLATVSHELRTPLTSMSGYLELLRDGGCGEVSPDVRSVLAIVERNTDRLTALIEDLLLLSRIEAAPTSDLSGTTALADLLPAVLAASAAVSVSGGTPSCATPQEDLTRWWVRGEHEHLHRALLAVLDNAVKFSPTGSPVCLRVEADSTEARIIVQDNGMGIPEGEVDAVFDRFARGSNASTQAVAGAGLGLSIARDLVRLHGGRIALDSVEGQGTTAVLTLALVGGPA